MREKDLFLLEFDKVRAALRSHCASEPGREASLCISPAFDRERIGEQLDWVDQCLSLLKQGIEIPLADFPRLDSWLLDVQAEGAFLEGKQLAEILSTAKLASNMRDFLRGLSDAYASLKKFSSSLHRIPLLEASLGKALEQDGSVKSSATPQLHAIRKTQAELKGRLSDRLHRLLRSRELRQLQQDPLVTLRNDRFVVTVPSDALHQIPGVVQDRSSSGKTCYVEPLFALEMNNKLLLSKREEREEEIQILRALTDEVKAKAGDLQEIFSALRKVDLIQARARLALQWNGVKPEMGGSVILLRQARHPLLLLSRRETVPVDISIPEGKRGLILTGPNMGGKTVCLKTLGLLALMAQAGFLIPAERGARLPVFDGVFTDIGDEQALESSLSTFSAHLTNLKEIYERVSPQGLVLLDELGTGTDPEEGSALGIGTLRAFLQRGCHLMVATHLKPVKLMGLTEESLEVASVEFDPQSFAPRFRLIYRTVGESMALRMARRLGFPEEILAEAEKERSGSDRDMALALESVRTIREEAERDLQRAVEEREELARLKEREESLLAELSEKRRRAWEKDIEAAQTFLSDLRKRGEELMLRLKKSPNRKHLSEFIAASAREIGGIEERAGLKSQGDAVKVGDSAEVLTGGWKGEVVAFSRDKVVIEREGMRLVVPADRLRKVQEKRDRRVLIQARSEDLPIEIDLRGLKVEEAVRQAGEYLDRAVRSRLDRVKLIHGFGTGALKCALEEYLGSSPYCLSFRAGDQNEGGGGVTFVELIR